MTLRPEWKERFMLQQKTFESLVKNFSEADLHAQPQPGKWGAFEHCAHLSHYQEITLARLADLIAGAATTAVSPYHSEEDPEFLAWCSLSTEKLVERYHIARKALMSELNEVDPEKVIHLLDHPTYGRLDVAALAEFFLHHEAHHLYQAYRLGLMARKSHDLLR